jgi:hypothetical protein
MRLKTAPLPRARRHSPATAAGCGAQTSSTPATHPPPSGCRRPTRAWPANPPAVRDGSDTCTRVAPRQTAFRPKKCASGTVCSANTVPPIVCSRCRGRREVATHTLRNTCSVSDQCSTALQPAMKQGANAVWAISQASSGAESARSLSSGTGTYMPRRTRCSHPCSAQRANCSGCGQPCVGQRRRGRLGRDRALGGAQHFGQARAGGGFEA